MQPTKPSFGQKIKNMFGGKKNKNKNMNTAGGAVVDEHVHTKTVTTTTTTAYDQGVQQQQHSHHQHGPLVANPYAQPAHGQIFVPANTAVQANPETGALLPASNLNGPVILPTGPKVIPIATNYPAGEAGPMVIPPSGGFINNSGNPYLTQQTYGPAGQTYVQNTYVERDVVDNRANEKYQKEEMKRQQQLEKDEMNRQKALEKEQQKIEKAEIKREKQLEKEQQQAIKNQEKLEQQMAKDQEKANKQLIKDQERIAKDQQKLENQIAKDQENLANNQAKLQNQADKNEAKLENQISKDQMRMQETMTKDFGANQAYVNQQEILAEQARAPIAQPIAQPIGGLAHGEKHVFVEETKQDAYTGQVISDQVYHKDTRF